jgi:hypothetical protein
MQTIESEKPLFKDIKGSLNGFRNLNQEVFRKKIRLYPKMQYQ